MRHLRRKLKKCSLFTDYSDENLSRVIKNLRYRVTEFAEDETLAVEGAKCHHLGIVLRGGVKIQKVYASGKIVTLSRLGPGAVFAEAVLFSDNKTYPATIEIDSAKTQIMFIRDQEVIRLCKSNQRFLNSFLGLLSDKVHTLNRRIQLLSYKTIRQKIAGYCLTERVRQRSEVLHLAMSREELAQHLGVPRPSVSRELSNMQDEGLIQLDKDKIRILNLEELERCLCD